MIEKEFPGAAIILHKTGTFPVVSIRYVVFLDKKTILKIRIKSTFNLSLNYSA